MPVILAASLFIRHLGRNLGTDGTFTGFCGLELGVRPVCPPGLPQHRQRRRLLALLRPKPPAVRGQAPAPSAWRRRQKKYESPQSTPAAAAQPHASGPSSRGRPLAQSVRRPLPHLVAYGNGSTNPLHTTNSRTPVAPDSPTVFHRTAKTPRNSAPRTRIGQKINLRWETPKSPPAPISPRTTHATNQETNKWSKPGKLRADS